MSLKQEFIDMLELIIKPMKDRDELTYFEIEQDSYRDICTKDNNVDVTYGGCFYCDNCDNNSCKYLKHIRVDIAVDSDLLDNEYGMCRFYIFGNKKADIEYANLAYIRNRKDLITEVSKIKIEVENFNKVWDSVFSDNYINGILYAIEFSQQIRRDFSYVIDDKTYSFFGNLDPDILPVVFRPYHSDDYDENSDTAVHGNVMHSRNGVQNQINIFFCADHTFDRLKQNIRHEIIHYALYVCDKKSKDDDAIFHYMCNVYDAHAYKEMPESEQQLYDKLICALKMLDYEKKHRIITDENYTTSKMGMLNAVGCHDNESEYYKHSMQMLNELSSAYIDAMKLKEKNCIYQYKKYTEKQKYTDIPKM